MCRKRRVGKRLFVLGMIGILAAAGCGGAGGTDGNRSGNRNENVKENGAGTAGNGAGGETSAAFGENGNGEKVMGRYMETVDDFFTGQALTGSRLVQQEDGSLAVFSVTEGKWVSGDHGAVWEQEPLPWFDGLKEKGYIRDAALSPDGCVGIIFEEKSALDGGEAEAEGGTEGNTETEPEEEKGQTEPEGDELQTEPSGSDRHPRYLLFSPEKAAEPEVTQPEMTESETMEYKMTEYKMTEYEIPYQEDGWLRNLNFSDDGRLFGSAVDGKIYELDRTDAGYRVAADFGEWVQYFEVWNGKLVAVTDTQIMIYDLETGRTVEDPVLDEFVEAQIGEKLRSTDGYNKPVLVIPDGDDILYLVFEKGIYRHVLGGSLVEQAADGTLNSLSNPSWKIGDGILREDGTFLLLLANGKLAGYAYHPEIPAMPDIRLRAYSLQEDSSLKMAIASYQAEHPEVYIRYDVGMDASSSVTKEDALKKLNTEIAAGNGPDFFLLDGMPMDSYMEKGILADITPVLDDLESESGQEPGGDIYFQNILRALESEKDGKVYAVPTAFILPVAGGRAGEIMQMGDLTSVADIVEQYRAEKPEGGILGVLREKDLLRQFLDVCAPAWEGEGGMLNEDKLEEFFIQMKRIWDAEKPAVTDKELEALDAYTEQLMQYGMTEKEAEQSRLSGVNWQGERYMTGKQEFMFARVESSFDFDLMVSCFHIKGRTDGDFGAYGGQADGVFIPRAIAGVGAVSAHREEAFGLLEKLVRESWSGCMADKGKMREHFMINATEDGGSYGSIEVQKEDGTTIGYNIYPASGEEVDRLLQMAQQAKTAYVENEVLENAVCEAGEKVLKGEITAKEGVEEVKKQVSLFMAE